MSFKQFVKRTVTSSLLLRKLVSRISGDMPRVFVYHRFTEAGKTVPHCISSDIFSWHLDRMQEHGRIISLASCLEYFYEHHKWPTKAVVITIDDGYRDFYQYAFPVLQERNLPATFFPTVNFINRRIWLWPDRLKAALATHDKASFVIDVEDGSGAVNIKYNNEVERAGAWGQLVDLCIASPDRIKQKIIQIVESQLGVELPKSPFQAYEPCSWNELQIMDSHGIEIGSHTMNHPILSKIEDDDLVEEVFTSKQEIERQLGSPVKTFCYPNSAPKDINEKVVASVKEAGYLGAVFGIDHKNWDPYRVPRLASEEDRTNFVWKLCGGENLARRQ